jgi:hypothetical protein
VACHQAPTGRRRKKQVDAVTVLTVYAVLLLLVPSTIVVPGLGSAGTPATVWAIVVLLWYVAAWLGGRHLAGAGNPRAAGRDRDLRGGGPAVVRRARPAWADRGGAERRRPVADPARRLGVDRDRRRPPGSATTAGSTRLMRVLVACGSVVAFIGIFEFFTGIDLVAYIQIPGFTTVAPPA